MNWSQATFLGLYAIDDTEPDIAQLFPVIPSPGSKWYVSLAVNSEHSQGEAVYWIRMASP